jgi:ORF6N domain.
VKARPPDITILTIRDQKVVLDGDLALVYGVTTKRLNEQFRRNRKRFPNDFAFHLTAEEFESLRSQATTLNAATGKRSQIVTASSDTTMWSQIATTSRDRRRKTHRPWVFTEHGALQVANILRSERAIAMSVYVIRAFIELREKVAANSAILKRLAEIDKTLLLHDSALRDVYEKLLPFLSPPREPPRRQIGFSAAS